MANWIILTVDDIPTYVVDALVNAMRTAALGETQADPLPDIIEDICDSLRLEISGCKGNELNATAHSIPKELKRHAIALIAEAALGRLTIDLSEDQRRAADNARALMRRIANCEVPVSTPDEAESTPTAQVGQPPPTGQAARPRHFGSRHEDGL